MKAIERLKIISLKIRNIEAIVAEYEGKITKALQDEVKSNLGSLE